MEFRDDQILRDARHILLDEIGGAGQMRLLSSRVLVIGAGGCQVQQQGRAKPAGADDEHPRAEEPHLAGAADLVKQDVPGVAQDLIVAKFHGRQARSRRGGIRVSLDADAVEQRCREVAFGK